MMNFLLKYTVQRLWGASYCHDILEPMHHAKLQHLTRFHFIACKYVWGLTDRSMSLKQLVSVQGTYKSWHPLQGASCLAQERLQASGCDSSGPNCKQAHDEAFAAWATTMESSSKTAGVKQAADCMVPASVKQAADCMVPASALRMAFAATYFTPTSKMPKLRNLCAANFKPQEWKEQRVVLTVMITSTMVLLQSTAGSMTSHLLEGMLPM